MNIESFLAAKIASRRDAGLSIMAYGAEGYTEDQPFTYHATDAEQRAKAERQLVAKGFTVRAI